MKILRLLATLVGTLSLPSGIIKGLSDLNAPVWESQELHQAPKPSGAEAVKQVKFTTPFVKPLQAKITEYAFINTKADHNSDEVETLLDELSVELHKASPHGNSYGPIIGTKADYLLIVG